MRNLRKDFLPNLKILDQIKDSLLVISQTDSNDNIFGQYSQEVRNDVIKFDRDYDSAKMSEDLLHTEATVTESRPAADVATEHSSDKNDDFDRYGDMAYSESTHMNDPDSEDYPDEGDDYSAPDSRIISKLYVAQWAKRKQKLKF